MKKDFVEELKWRGMLQDMIPGTDGLLRKQMVRGDIGFDPTADSRGVGNMGPIMTLLHFQQGGDQPIALNRGGTERRAVAPQCRVSLVSHSARRGAWVSQEAQCRCVFADGQSVFEKAEYQQIAGVARSGRVECGPRRSDSRPLGQRRRQEQRRSTRPELALGPHSTRPLRAQQISGSRDLRKRTDRGSWTTRSTLSAAAW